ncbi:GNAT family N-acetyltransferase [Pseudoroseicyclus aestuarii]|uniref:L-amino acid N-acyltransferase YncA n=1 Tax=Pseudoroseicyclus aestuarii TaxID=1795041 RepID=A0A318T4V1_9RHOB|nr:GNAT family N-acetyltransferase [Pseudoroseicyclus aestuarii]PYE82301.1 L-amino acid N-acyltransferase YncA [Pseudoroseicyclus aestuarii]
MSLQLRPYAPADWPALWPILRSVIRAGDTYTYAPDTDEDTARALWLDPPSTRVVVAEEAGRILGTAHMGPNRDGPGDHIANASYMVAEAARGRGVGRAMVRDTIRWAGEAGYHGIQFNAVAASNEGALALYADLGFVTLGAVPGGFRHPQRGFVDLHILYRALP